MYIFYLLYSFVVIDIYVQIVVVLYAVRLLLLLLYVCVDLSDVVVT